MSGAQLMRIGEIDSVGSIDYVVGRDDALLWRNETLLDQREKISRIGHSTGLNSQKLRRFVTVTEISTYFANQ